MKITIKGTNLIVTDAIGDYVKQKIAHLNKFAKNLQLARIELESMTEHKTRTHFRAEATVDAPHHVYRAESRENDLYAAIDTLLPKLVSQLENDRLRKRAATRRKIRQIKESGSEI